MLVIDDHAIVRAGLKQIVTSDADVVVAGEASTGTEALAKIAADGFDVVVLDLSLPDNSGFNVLIQIAAARPDLPVLILSVEREEEVAVMALRAGAAGYLEKASALEQLVTAIKQVAEGKRYLSTALAERLAMQSDSVNGALPHDLLSPREFQVFLEITEGKPVSRIASELGLSVKTVNNHRSRILSKLGMKSNAELVRYAMRHHLIH